VKWLIANIMTTEDVLCEESDDCELSLIGQYVSDDPLQNFFLSETVDSQEREQLFCMKLRQCVVIFDFTEPLSDIQYKEIKKNALQEMLDFLNNNRNVITEALYPEMFNVVSFFQLFIFNLIEILIIDCFVESRRSSNTGFFSFSGRLMSKLKKNYILQH
jgi:Protein phosphatase 2A regulatory B subunit (B56 family)